jgi:hypothetical protein
MDIAMADQAHEVRVHIDEEAHRSPTPTTGTALYELGHIPHDRELFREVGGDEEDVPVPRDGAEIRLKEDEHFHSAKEWKIVVNGQQKTVIKRRLTFGEVLEIAFPKPRPAPDKEYKITYKHAASNPHVGSLHPGEVVKIKNGTDFDVKDTTKS